MEAVNSTPFLMDRVVYLDRNAAERLVVVLKATYSVSARGEISVAKTQAPIHPGEVFRGEPGESSILHEAELGPTKPATDVFLLGSAKAPGTGIRSMDVSFRVGPVGRTARVFGERRWIIVVSWAVLAMAGTLAQFATYRRPRTEVKEVLIREATEKGEYLKLVDRLLEQQALTLAGMRPGRYHIAWHDTYNGFTITSNSSKIQGLTVRNCQYGVAIYAPGQGNTVGVDGDGSGDGATSGVARGS